MHQLLGDFVGPTHVSTDKAKAHPSVLSISSERTERDASGSTVPYIKLLLFSGTLLRHPL